MVFDPDPSAEQAGTGHLGLDTQRARQRAGARQQGLVGTGFTPPLQHRGQALQRRRCPDQYRMRHVRRCSHDVEQMMYPVTQINVGNTAFAEHRFGPARPPPAVSVTRAVADARVSLGLLDDNLGRAAVDRRAKDLAQKLTRDGDDIVPPVKTGVELLHPASRARWPG